MEEYKWLVIPVSWLALCFILVCIEPKFALPATIISYALFVHTVITQDEKRREERWKKINGNR